MGVNTVVYGAWSDKLAADEADSDPVFAIGDGIMLFAIVGGTGATTGADVVVLNFVAVDGLKIVSGRSQFVLICLSILELPASSWGYILILWASDPRIASLYQAATNKPCIAAVEHTTIWAAIIALHCLPTP